MIALVKNLDIPIIDIHLEVFANLSDPGLFFPFGNPGHYNAEGYNLIAKAITKRLRADGVLQ